MTSWTTRTAQWVGATSTTVLLLLAAGCGGQEEDEDGGPMRSTAAPTSIDETEVNGLMTPAAFSDIDNGEERAAALFMEMSKVILHPRCANCHPKTGGPTQGDDMTPHEPPVIRAQNMGAPGMECTTCHGSENVAFASMEGSIPGSSPWMLPPASMGWQGSSPAEVCAQIKDQNLNGGRTLADLVEHNSVDHLVNWAWNPGEGREPAPGDQETFGALTAAWVQAGAACPQS